MKKEITILVGCMITLLFVSNANAFQRTINCSDVDCIRNAMANARPGDEIIIAPGSYVPGNKIKHEPSGIWSRFVAKESGTEDKPIILRGSSSSNKPVFSAPGTRQGEILLLTGNYWRIQDIEVVNGKRGILTDKANHNELISIDVHNIGSEAIHIRNSSSYYLIKNCKVYDTGKDDPRVGEGIYIGSSSNSHGQYGADCDHCTIENCTIGPNVAAEGVDVKEGTSNTIIRNCVFSGKGISGENSADAMVDLKGIYGFVYNNSFKRDGSSVIASGIDFQEVSVSNSGFKNAIFNNTFDFDGIASIPTARRKGGDPYEIHFWNNTRDTDVTHFPPEDSSHNRTMRALVFSCPSWNVEPCGTLSVSEVGDQHNFTIIQTPGQKRFTVLGVAGKQNNIKVFDIQGKMVSKISSSHAITDIDLSDTPNGIYVVLLNAGDGTLSKLINL